MKKNLVIFIMMLLPCVAVTANRSKNGVVNFMFYGSELQVHFDASKRIKLKKENSEQTAKCLEWLMSATEETLNECLQIKKEMNLCDWAYLKMLEKLSETSLGKTNEATLMMSMLLHLSGYDIRLGWGDSKLLKMLFCSDVDIFGMSYVNVNNRFYYVYGDANPENLKVESENVTLPPTLGMPLSLKNIGSQKFAVNLSEPRTVKSFKNEDFSFTFQVNKNLVDFYGDMPSFYYDKDFMTRWTSMANIPLDKHLHDTLLKDMKAKLAGLSQKDAVQQLLTWMQGTIDLERKNLNQDVFLYAYDDDVWGYDRALYAEETLFYPYSDTEDRSILLSRLIRDLLGLKVLFIYYPGHTAIGVCITDEDVPGAYVVKDGMHFVICDPTYIGSNVGEEMPTVVHLEKTVRLLDN